MKIAVVIPTFNRIEKLERCLKSLDNQTYKNFEIIVYCDNNDKKTYDYLNDRAEGFGLLGPKGCIKTFHRYLNDKQEFVIGSWNKFFTMSMTEFPMYFGAYAWIVDDVELYPHYLEELVKAMKTDFADTDGVIGAKQECPNHPEYTFKWFGQCLIGRKFIERYKDVYYQVCCPDYKHFYQDEEMWMFANSLGKFKNCETAVLKHYHPAFVKEEIDETHPLVRGKVKREDDVVYRERRAKNLVWGQTWQRLKLSQ